MVYVISKTGKNLMPTNRHGKVRRMLKECKAKVICKLPFTIQLLFDTTEFTQQIKVGINVGDTVGYAITVNDNVVIDKGEISLRTDVSKLLTQRSTLRGSRRDRNTRYREARFLNRGNKKEGWLPPSILNKFNNIIGWINRLTKYLPDYKLMVEIMNFDTQKMENTNISGKEYQQGSLYGYKNVKQYLLFRDQGKCQVCHKGYDGKGWHIHHIKQRKDGGTNKPSNLALLHKDCHIKLHKKNLKIKKAPAKRLKECAYFNSLRLRFMDILKEKYEDSVAFTYGYITKINRNELNLNKTHYNDAIAITGLTEIKSDNVLITVIKQVRKKKRSLHEAMARKGRKEPNVNSVRNKKNTKEIIVNGVKYALWDKVLIGNKKGYISGFTGESCYIQDIDGNYIKAAGNDKSYKQVSVKNIKHIRRNNNWIIERKVA